MIICGSSFLRRVDYFYSIDLLAKTQKSVKRLIEKSPKHLFSNEKISSAVLPPIKKGKNSSSPFHLHLLVSLSYLGTGAHVVHCAYKKIFWLIVD